MTNRSASALSWLLTPLLTPLALCLLPLVVSAQQPLVVDDNYRLQAGDVIIVSVLGEQGLGGNLTVGPGGSIALPIVGSVPVNGLTLRETRDLIARLYQDVLRRPYISVALDENASKRKVFVSGRVEKPGPQLLPLGSTLPDAVVAAGLTDEADLSQVTLRRHRGEVIVSDLTGLRTAQPVDTGIFLEWNDRIFVPTRDARLTILGQVARPGAYTVPLGRQLTVVDLLTQIGGGLTDQASRAALLYRAAEAQPEEIDLNRLLNQGDLSQNYVLQGGDTLVVPEASRVTIAGEVNAPISLYPGTGLTLLEGLIRAGGFTANAGLKQAQLRRGNQVCLLDLEELWRRGNLADNIPLLPGDVLVVPRARSEEVLFVGAVQRAGALDVRDQENTSLLKLLTAAGKAPNADLTRVSIYRENALLVANVQAAIEQGDMRHNPQLQPGDVVYVPEVGKVALLGAWLRPGLLDYDPRLTFLQYLTTGGLPAASAAYLDRGMLIRTRPDGTYETVAFDASRIMKGDIPEPLKVKPGDVLFLQPRGPRRDLLTSVRDVLFTIGAITALIPGL